MSLWSHTDEKYDRFPNIPPRIWGRNSDAISRIPRWWYFVVGKIRRMTNRIEIKIISMWITTKFVRYDVIHKHCSSRSHRTSEVHPWHQLLIKKTFANHQMRIRRKQNYSSCVCVCACEDIKSGYFIAIHPPSHIHTCDTCELNCSCVRECLCVCVHVSVHTALINHEIV